MDRSDRVASSGRSDLGIPRLDHQQPRSARPGEAHGRRCPVSSVPGQRRLQRPGPVHLVLELCFAGIMAVLVNSWSQKPGHVRPKPVRFTPLGATRFGRCAYCRFTSNPSGGHRNPSRATCDDWLSSPQPAPHHRRWLNAKAEAAKRGLLQHRRRACGPRRRVANKAPSSDSIVLAYSKP